MFINLLVCRFTISVGAEHKIDASEGYRGNGKYEHLHEHRVDIENGDAQARPGHREMPSRPAAAGQCHFFDHYFALLAVDRLSRISTGCL